MPHETELRVRFYELDPYDHVNHTNYLRYFETARIEFLTDHGFGLDVLKQRGIHIVVIDLRARFLNPAGLNDVLTVVTRVEAMGRVASTWAQDMRREDEPIASLEIRAAFTDVEGRPRRVPADFARAMVGPEATGPVS